MQKLTTFLALVLYSSIQVASADTITIGAEDDAAPWSYHDGSGYVNDLVKAAYAAAGWQVKYDVLPYSRCKTDAEAGVRAACFTTGRTVETEKTLLFPTLPVFTAHNTLFANADSALTGCNPSNWGGKISVGMVAGYEYGESLASLQTEGAITTSTTMSEKLLLRMLTVRRLDAAVINVDAVKKIEMVAAIAGVPSAFKKVCDLGGEPGYLAFSRKHGQAISAMKAFNRGMAIIQNNGTQERLQTEWAEKAITRIPAGAP